MPRVVGTPKYLGKVTTIPKLDAIAKGEGRFIGDVTSYITHHWLLQMAVRGCSEAAPLEHDKEAY